MSVTRYLPTADLPSFLTLLAQKAELLVPTEQGKAIVFAPYKKGTTPILKRSTVSPKEAALPPCETIIEYKRSKAEDNPAHVTIALQDKPKADPKIIFACRPCDAQGFTVLDRPYLQGPYKDPYYAAKRKALTVITQTCDTGCATCFCTSTGGSPDSPSGSDIIFTAISDGFLFEATSPKGEALLQNCQIENGNLTDGSAKIADAEEKRAAGRAAMAQKLNFTKAATSIKNAFNNAALWQKETAHCLGCGACTYFCPTCYCFTLTDEGEGLGETPGKRLRSWDTCMGSQFTREASGHNPRALKANRMRNRVSHKFSFYPQVWQGEFSCSGCGRCIAKCPVHVDIRAIVLAAIKSQEEGK